MQNRRMILIVLLVLGLALVPIGCKKKAEETVPEPEPAAAETQQPAEEAADTAPPVEMTDGFEQEKPYVEEMPRLSAAEWNARGTLKTIYFEFDKADLGNDARANLRANAEWMRANTDYTVVIEGHCDERGTIEYNLALGQRRAQTVRDYLSSLGVSASRLRAKSFGEEKPVDLGHTDAAWAKNRRAEFVVE